MSSSIDTGVSARIFQFSGSTGEHVFFQAQNNSAGFYDLFWTLYGPNNQYITNSYFGSNLAAALPSNGTYLLVVNGTNPSNTSGVTFSFTAYENVNPTKTLVLNSQVTGTITNPGDEATYTFIGSSGQLIEFNGLKPGSYIYATLDDPEGSQVFSQYMTSNAGPYLLRVAGTYTLTVLGSSTTPTGAYTFDLVDFGSEPRIQVNTSEADLTVTLSEPWTQQILVPYSTADDTATVADGDYKPASGVIRFAPGQTTATVVVQAIDRFAPTTTDFLVNLGNPVDATIAPGQGTGMVTIESNVNGTVSGEVFDDVSGSGTLKSGDPGIPGVTVELLGPNSVVVASATSDSQGNYTISNIPAGSYSVVEVTPSGYVLTAPASGDYSENNTSGQTISGLNFGNFQTVTLSGEVFTDNNGNGAPDGGEPGLSGWTVDLVNSANQVIATTSVANGSYAFNNVGPGTYTVKVIVQNGFMATTATSFKVTTSSGGNVSDLNFGVFAPVTFSGEVYNDLNGLVLTLTTHQNFEASAGWYDTPVSTGSFIATFTYTDVTGNNSADGVAIVLQNDTRGTSALGSSGSGLGYGGISPSAAYEINIYGGHTQGANYATNGSTGNYTSTGSVSVQSGDPIDVTLTYSAAAATLTAVLTDATTGATYSQTYTSIDLATQLGGATALVGFTGADGGVSSIQTISNFDFIPASGPTVTGFGVNGSGWSLLGNASVGTSSTSSMLNSGDPGLPNWTVNLINSANQVIATTTDSGGGYGFGNIGPGTYTVQVVQQSGYVPSSPITLSVTAQSGINRADLNFGEFVPVTLSGEVFGDTDGNGILGGAEAGLAGWTVNLLGSTIRTSAPRQPAWTEATRSPALARIDTRFRLCNRPVMSRARASCRSRRRAARACRT